MNTLLLMFLAVAPVKIQPETAVAPPLPPLAAGGGIVMLEVFVEASGKVGAIQTLKDGPPFTDLLKEAVGQWRFETRMKGSTPVLVAAVIRQPDVFETAGTDELPDPKGWPDVLPLPTRIVHPPYPPGALSGDVAIVELEVGQRGRAIAIREVREAPAFDDAVLTTVPIWRFRATTKNAADTPSVVYLVFGFLQPRTRP